LPLPRVAAQALHIKGGTKFWRLLHLHRQSNTPKGLDAFAWVDQVFLTCLLSIVFDTKRK